MGDQKIDGFEIPRSAVTADGSDASGANIADATEFLAGVYVRNMHLNRGDPGGFEGIKERDAGVGVGTGIQDDAVNSLKKALVDTIDERALVIALHTLDGNTLFLRVVFNGLDEGIIGLVSVDARLTNTEQIEVGTVQNVDLHRESSFKIALTVREKSSPTGNVTSHTRR